MVQRRGLSEGDREAWAAYVRHVRALPGREAPAPPPASPPPATPPAMPLAPVQRARTAVALEVGAQPGGVDNRIWTRLRTGKLPVARRLDLHGQTAQAAHGALRAFLIQAQAEEVRVVEVITGRGSGEHGGVLRRELPLWLNLPPLRGMVLAMVHPHAANVGAVRLLLRRRR